MLAGDQFRQILALLLGVAVQLDLIDAEIGMGAIGERHGGGRASDLLDHDRMRQIAHVDAAEFLRHGDAKKAERAHFRPELVRKHIGAINLRRARLQLLLSPAMGHRLQGLDLLTKSEPHRMMEHIFLPLLRVAWPSSKPAMTTRENAVSGHAFQHHLFVDILDLFPAKPTASTIPGVDAGQHGEDGHGGNMRLLQPEFARLGTLGEDGFQLAFVSLAQRFNAAKPSGSSARSSM